MANSTEIGTAYLRVKPKVDNSFERDIESAGGRAGGGFGGAFQVAVGNIMANVATSAATLIADTMKTAFSEYSNYEQLVGGVEKIFDQMDTSRIFADAQNAYKELNMSANEYMETINQAGAVFAQTMGDEKGYQVARDGMLAISDYASGTGRDIDELNEKFRMISRSSASYQSIADQFAGILPQTSQDFLEQAQAAGLLSDQYTSLTEVPLADYQQALVGMLQLGVEGLGLTGNTLAESTETISGSLAMLDSAWSDFLVAIFDEDADMDAAVGKLMDSAEAAFINVMPRLQTAARSFFFAIPSAFMSVLEEQFPGITDALAQVQEAFQPAIESMQRIGEELAPMIGPAMDALGQTFVNNVIPALMRLGEAASYFFEQLEPWAPHIMNVLVFALEGLVVTVAAVIDIIAACANIFGTVLEAGTAFCDFVEAAPETIGNFASDVQTFFGNIDDNICDAMDSAGEAIDSWATDIQTNATNAIDDFESDVHSTFLDIGNTVTNTMGSVQATFANAWGTITGTFSNAAQTIQGTMQGVSDFIWGIINNISSAFSSITVNWPHIPLPHFNWHWESVGGMINIPWFDGIDWYGMGGFVDDATLIGVGERGGELVWPSYEPYLGRYADAIADRLGGRGGVDIHDCTFVVRREDDIRRVAVELNTLINRQTAGGIA